jgi:hypothetical protein
MTRSSEADDRRTSRCSAALPLLLALALALVPSPGAAAQQLDLPGPVGPPLLAPPTYGSDLVETLEQEIQDLAREERGADEWLQPFVRASITWRIIAAELIDQGEASGPLGSGSVVAGWRLARYRTDIDETLKSIAKRAAAAWRDGTGGPKEAARLTEPVRRFIDLAIDHADDVRRIEPDQLDAGLARILAPLRSAAERELDAAAQNHWPTTARVLPPAPSSDGADDGDDGDPDADATGADAASPTDVETLLARVRTAPVPGATRRRLEELLTRTPPPSARGLATLGLVLDRVDSARARPDVRLPRQLRPVAGKLEQAYARAEKTLMREIARLGDDAHPLSDPGFLSLLDDQRQYLADLERVAHLGEWVEAVRAIHPPSAGAFETRMTRIARSLLDTSRRSEAVRTMDRFERELAAYRALPFENELVAQSRETIVATGGLHAELLTAVSTVRRDWALTWSTGEQVDAASRRMSLLARLLAAMEGNVELLRVQTDVALLDRWAAWEMPPPLLRRQRTDVIGRLKLAAAAAIAGRDDELDELLSAVERVGPVTRLVARLVPLLEPALRDHSDGALGALGQTTLPPPSDAFLLDRRADLAMLCRYAVEADHARAGGRPDEAAAAEAWANELALSLLREVPPAAYTAAP